jgi:phosphohistidine swiveling domain-containing protein
MTKGGIVMWTLRLDDPRALDAAVAGVKAANLARAAAAGLPVLPGFVLTTAAGATLEAGTASGELEGEVRAAWQWLSGDGRRRLVVRSSSVAEDGAAFSMAGRFVSVLGVVGWSGFRAAVGQMLVSARTGRSPQVGSAAAAGRAAPMAVLVQPELDPAAAGVLFGVDPVGGRADRLLVAAVAGSPEPLVAGRVTGTRYVLSRGGRRLDADGEGPLGRRQLRSLARLAARARAVFGGPQDIEWAVDRAGRWWLLQSRPVTATAARPARGSRLLGPGPLAETFPQPLGPLEADLWVAPLHDGICEALGLLGVASRRRLGRWPVVQTVQGRVAGDLELLGGAPPRRGLLGRLDPRLPARRLLAAWRVGRLRAALPLLTADLIAHADRALTAVPALEELDAGQLGAVLGWSRGMLTSLHGYEALAGALLGIPAPGGPPGRPGRSGRAAGTVGAGTEGPLTAASLALRVLAAGRAEGLEDQQLVSHRPVVLALLAREVAASRRLPPTPTTSIVGGTVEVAALPAREALRLRTRWVQELSALAAVEAGVRLVRAGILADPLLVRRLRLEELAAALAGGRLPDGLAERPLAAGPPLPAAFRLAADGRVVPLRQPRNMPPGGGQGVGGGRGVGVVHHGGSGSPPAGAVLVVGTLDPHLAGWLPGLGGLVAETGSPLSHLAILARELNVPTVVAVAGALERFPPGSRVLVDGTLGEVARLDHPSSTAASTPTRNAA